MSRLLLTMTLLLTACSLPGALDSHSDTPESKAATQALFSAAQTGDTASVNTLLAQGADPNGKAARGWTPLMFAALGGHIDAVQVLLSKGAAVNVLSDDGASPLMAATLRRHGDTVRLLLANKADVSLTNKDGVSAIRIAEEKGFTEIVDLLRVGVGSAASATELRAALEQLRDTIATFGQGPAFAPSTTTATAKVVPRAFDSCTVAVDTLIAYSAGDYPISRERVYVPLGKADSGAVRVSGIGPYGWLVQVYAVGKQEVFRHEVVMFQTDGVTRIPFSPKTAEKFKRDGDAVGIDESVHMIPGFQTRFVNRAAADRAAEGFGKVIRLCQNK